MLLKFFFIKRVLLAFFFITAVLNTSSVFASQLSSPIWTDEQVLKLAQLPQWKILLHAKSSRKIDDPKFILSSSYFSFKNELIETLKAFHVKNYTDINNHPICRLPARYLFIEEQLRQQKSKHLLPKANCPELNKFLDYVPMDSLDLVFASSDLNSATSMMGHIFLKANGNSSRGNFVEHALSFYNEINSNNPIKLFYTGLVSGMPGYFLVKPYQEVSSRYLNKEQRNLWSYELTSSKYQRQLLQMHLWELKDIDIKYLFQSYNCATLTLYVLGLIDTAVVDFETAWVSPLDVVKAVSDVGLIHNTNVQLSEDWSKKESTIFDPVVYPQDSVLSFGFKRQKSEDIITLTFLPASHNINLDSRKYGLESELTIFGVNAELNASSNKLKINWFDLYSVTTYENSDENIFNVSHFSLGYRPFFESDLEKKNYTSISYGQGASKRVFDELLLYGLLKINGSTNLSESFLSYTTSLGLIFYPFTSAKLVMDVSKNTSGIDKLDTLTKEVSLSIFQNNRYTYLINWERIENDYNKTHSISFNVAMSF